MHKKLNYIKIIIAFLFSISNLFAQKFELGIPFITNYNPKDYLTHNQNWAIEQDLRGIMYFGNTSGLLFNSGNKWGGTEVSKTARIRSLAKDNLGRIYIGAEHDFGFFEPDSLGDLQYVSMSQDLKDGQNDFLEVWSTFVINNDVYFCTKFAVYKYNNNKLVALYKPNTNNSFHKFFVVNNSFYLREHGLGLLCEKNGVLLPIEDGEMFATTKVDVLLQLPRGLLIGTRTNGFYIQSINKVGQKSITEIKHNIPEINANNNELYCGIKLHNGNIALGTLQNGIFIIDDDFNLLSHLNKAKGLNDNKVHYLFEDFHHNIWAAFDKGISMIDYFSPFTKYDELTGLEGNVNSIIKHNNFYYASTSQGLFLLPVSNYLGSKFSPIFKSKECYNLFEFESKKNEKLLLVATKDGLYMIDKNNNTKLIDNAHYYTMHQPKCASQFLYAGGNGFLSKFRFSNGIFTIENIVNCNGEARSIASDNNFNAYVGIEKVGVYTIHISNNDTLLKALPMPEMKHESNFRVFSLNNKIIIATYQGFYEFTENKKVIKSTIISNELKADIYSAKIDSRNNVWMSYTNNDFRYIGLAINCNKPQYIFNNSMFKKLANAEVNDYYFEDYNTTWFASNDGLYKFNLKNTRNVTHKFYSIINTVKIQKRNKIFLGTCYKIIDGQRYPSTIQSNDLISKIPYDKNALEFEFTAAYFNNRNEIYYSSYLSNFDEEYTPWAKETRREITNLHEGEYTFYLRAKDVFGNVSETAKYSFIIQTPYYRTFWAYIVYFVLVVFVIYSIVKYNTKRLKEQNELLENTVTERTKEIESQKNELQVMNTEITDSINYAKIIQSAILPQEETIREYFKENIFIFFKPRNVVSGDFYWFTQLEEKCFIACADCTGHGVPGAFMSMVGMEKLSQAVKEISPLKVSNILSFINIGIKRSLGQVNEKHQSKDGMEMALCEFNLSEKTMKYAGANRPLWLFRKVTKTEYESIIYKPTKAGIASSTELTQEYEEQHIDLKINDNVYLFSDGAPDQFGGEKGKKLMTTGLREMLLSIQHLNMQLQKEHIENFYKNWMHNFEQVDDILIIGIKV